MNNSLFYRTFSVFYKLARGSEVGQSQVYNPEKIQRIGDSIQNNLVFALLLALPLIIIYKKKRCWLLQTLMILVIVDLFYFSSGNLITLPMKTINASKNAAEWLSTHAGYNRFLSTNGNLPYTGLGVYWSHLRAREPFSNNGMTDEELVNYQKLSYTLLALPENQGISKNIFDVSGYAAMIPRVYMNYWGDSSSPNAVPISDLSNPKLDSFSIKYIVTGYPEDYIKQLEDEKWELVNVDDQIKIYKNHDSFPRTYLTNQVSNSDSVDILKYEPNIIEIQANLQQPNTLVLTDTYYPGWKAFVNNIEVPINRHQNVMRSVNIPNGRNKIMFSYQPLSLIIGAIISCVTAATMCIVFIWKRKT